LNGFKERGARKKVRLDGRMRNERGWIDVKIKNLSDSGLMAECTAPPSRGHYIEIRRHNHVLIGVVAWSKDNRFGVRLADRTDMRALIDGKPLERAGERRNMATRPGSRRAIVLSTPSDWRWLGKTFERVAIVAITTAGTVIIAQMVYEELSMPLGKVASALHP